MLVYNALPKHLILGRQLVQTKLPAPANNLVVCQPHGTVYAYRVFSRSNVSAQVYFAIRRHYAPVDNLVVCLAHGTVYTHTHTHTLTHTHTHLHICMYICKYILRPN